MGLFSVLTESIGGSGGGDDDAPSATSASASASSSGSIPTVIQLYTGSQPIQFDDTATLTGYSAVTYQAVQIGAESDLLLKHKHSTPDLGVWNCRVSGTPLVDSLLAKVATKVTVFCMSVDLTSANEVEPTISLLQGALTRHLIEHPPPTPGPEDEEAAAAAGAGAAAAPEDEGTSPPKIDIATTSLHDLQTAEFGRANEDVDKDKDNKGKEPPTIHESFKDVKTTLLICAQMPAVSNDAHDDDGDAYKKNQAQALIIYHLRKFAAALNASLCFVAAPLVEQTPQQQQQQQQSTLPGSPSKDSTASTAAATATAAAVAANATLNSSSSLQPTIDYAILSRWWRDLALGQPIWENEAATPRTGGGASFSGVNGEEPSAAITPETVVTARPLYGPTGKHDTHDDNDNDLMETVVLRSAHYPGHWDAAKDSVWKALPAAPPTVTDAPSAQGGDQGWLTQLRDSIAAANDLPPPAAAATPERSAEEPPKEKDAAEVTDFFASLLKKP